MFTDGIWIVPLNIAIIVRSAFLKAFLCFKSVSYLDYYLLVVIHHFVREGVKRFLYPVHPGNR